MRLQIDAKDLHKAVQTAALAVRDIGVPILLCVKLEAKDNRLIATGTDSDTMAVSYVEAAVSEGGVAVVSMPDLKAITQRLRGLVSISIKGENLSLSTMSASLVLPTVPGIFPVMQKPSRENEVIDGVDALKACGPYCATSDNQPNLKGVIFDRGTALGTTGNQFYAVPCDGRDTAIVPPSAQPFASKISGRLFLGETTWRIEGPGVYVLGRLLDLPVIDWQRITLASEPILSFDADELISAAEMATVGRGEWCYLKSENGTLSVSGDKFKGAHIETNCETRCDGSDLSFVVTTKLLLSSLRPFAGSVVSMSTNGSILRFDPEGGKGFTLTTALRDHRTKLVSA